MRFYKLPLLWVMLSVSVFAPAQDKESAAEREVRSLSAEIETYSEWATRNNEALLELAGSLRVQSEVDKLLFSKARDYCTVVFSDGRVVSGDYDWNEPSAKFTRSVTAIAESVRAGSLWGFYIARDGLVVRLYLAPNLYIVDISLSAYDEVERLSRWSASGPDPRGDCCFSIGPRLFLCTERR